MTLGDERCREGVEIKEDKADFVLIIYKLYLFCTAPTAEASNMGLGGGGGRRGGIHQN